MPWSEIFAGVSAAFAGIAAVTSVAVFVYGVLQHRNNVRKECILWAIKELDKPDHREARALIYEMRSDLTRREAVVEQIKAGNLRSEELTRMRSVFTVFNHIGYFWIRMGFGHTEDAVALFPQIVSIWEIGRPVIEEIRKRPNQSTSFVYLQRLAESISHPVKHSDAALE